MTYRILTACLFIALVASSHAMAEETEREAALTNVAEAAVSDKMCGTRFQLILAMEINKSAGIEQSSFSDAELKQASESALKNYEEIGSKVFCSGITNGMAMTLIGIVQKQGPVR